MNSQEDNTKVYFKVFGVVTAAVGIIFIGGVLESISEGIVLFLAAAAFSLLVARLLVLRRRATFRILARDPVLIAAFLAVIVLGAILSMLMRHEKPAQIRDRRLEAAAQVRQCISQHRLTEAHPPPKVKKIKLYLGESVHLDGGPASLRIFESCDWPPLTSPDGYTMIQNVTVDGPQKNGVSEWSVADRLNSSCSKYEVTYTLLRGAGGPLDPIIVEAGQIVAGMGEPWKPHDVERIDELGFVPARGEAIVLSNHQVRLDTVKCL